MVDYNTLKYLKKNECRKLKESLYYKCMIIFLFLGKQINSTKCN